jgi:hypothetical protein
MIKLTPSITAIYHSLFAPSYDLVKTWAEQPQRLDSTIIKKLDASALAQQEKQAYLHSKIPAEGSKENDIITELFTATSNNNPPPQDASIPDAIRQLIQQRNQAALHTFSQSPCEGMIILVGKGDGSGKDLELAMASPLVVILDKKSRHKNVWNAWMVAKETDYATDWDMVFDPHNDAPLDPLAGMVQVWNPLQINVSLIGKPIGELTTERLTKLRNLANHYKKNAALTEDTDTHSEIMRQYQQMYHDVAHFIDKRALQTENSFERWKTALLAQAETLGKCFTPVSVVHYAMGTDDTEDKEKHWVLDENYQFNFNKQLVDGKLLIEISIKHTNPSDSQFTIEYKENGFLAHHAILSKQPDTTEFICDPDNEDINNPTELIIKDSQGNELHRLNLSNPTK